MNAPHEANDSLTYANPSPAPDPAAFTPMSVGQILDRTFRLYRANFLRFVTVAAVVQVPLSLVGAFAMFPMKRLIDPQTGKLAMDAEHPDLDRIVTIALLSLGTLFLFVLIAVIAQTLSAGAFAKSVSEAYLGRSATMSEVYRCILPRFRRLLGSALLTALAVGAGYMFCVVPGVVFSVWFAMTTPAIVVEELGAVDGMSRSKQLVSGNLGRMFSVGLVVFLLAIVVQLVPDILASWVSKMIAMQGHALLSSTVEQFMMLPGQLILAPVGSIAIVLMYYDLRIRKEGFDLEMLARSLHRQKP